MLESWFPKGYVFTPQDEISRALSGDSQWQIFATTSGRRLFVAKSALAERWVELKLIGDEIFTPLEYGEESFCFFSCDSDYKLEQITGNSYAKSKPDAISFAHSINASRQICQACSFHDAIYVEIYSRLLPTFTLTSEVSDDIVLGYWLTGGLPISVLSKRKILQSVSYLDSGDLDDVLAAAGLGERELLITAPTSKAKPAQTKTRTIGAAIDRDVIKATFELPGRKELSDFFNEYVIDFVNNEERYKKLGVSFPSGVILHGPPGSGKTYAIEKLTDFLGWPLFEVDASSVASPYIHETSKKIAELFDKAIDNAPSVLIIDEMDAFLSERGDSDHQHRVEEIAEFLRRIPEASKNKVLVIGMTNRIDSIDPAILRRGRFDHILHVDYASEDEVLQVFAKYLDSIPHDVDLPLAELSKRLVGRPLSDVAFVLREAARLSAKEGLDKISIQNLNLALEHTSARGPELSKKKRIGFF